VMSQTAAQPATTPIPVQLSEPEVVLENNNERLKQLSAEELPLFRALL
jgi:hypothetical protein